MPISQNVRFSGNVSPDPEFDHPPGASIARLLKISLAQRGWDVSEIDNWRDCGWSLRCGPHDSKQELVIVRMASESEWMLQIAPAYVPGVIGWLLRKKASASASEVYRLAMAVHQALSAQTNLADFKWCWDSFPEEGTSTPQPSPI